MSSINVLFFYRSVMKKYFTKFSCVYFLNKRAVIYRVFTLTLSF